MFVNKGWPYGEPKPDHEFLAPNYRITELQSAVLLAGSPPRRQRRRAGSPPPSA